MGTGLEQNVDCEIFPQTYPICSVWQGWVRTQFSQPKINSSGHVVIGLINPVCHALTEPASEPVSRASEQAEEGVSESLGIGHTQERPPTVAQASKLLALE